MRFLLTMTAMFMVSGCASMLPPSRVAESCEKPWKVCISGFNCYYCQEATIGGAVSCIRTTEHIAESNSNIDLLMFGTSVVEMSWLKQCSAPYHEEQTPNFY